MWKNLLKFLRELLKEIWLSKSINTAEKLGNQYDEFDHSNEQPTSSFQENTKAYKYLGKLSLDSKQAVQGLIKAIETSVSITTKTADHASEAKKIAEEGGSEATKAVQKMNNIKDSVISSAKVIGDLGDKSKQIHDIVDTINQISEQTNLLALNAAIEAARAGEAGRGFAVVADEVRKLAEESKQATGQIDRMVAEIIDTTSKAVTSMQQGTSDVEESSTVINSALKSLENISSKVADVAEQIDEVNTAADLQKGLSENVEKSIDEVSTVANDISQNLTSKADELKQLISTFKTD
jgi:methyl-accepting chemotaxis protein